MISIDVDKHVFLRHSGFYTIAIVIRQTFQPHHFQLGSHLVYSREGSSEAFVSTAVSKPYGPAGGVHI
jgi:hypothetical protein